jgi:CheY-like chemotaxis protein
VSLQLSRFAATLPLLCFICTQALGQERAPAPSPVREADEQYRRFFKPPETTLEYWAAMRFEIDVGKFNLAADYLKGFLAKNPTDQELVQIESEEGMSAFLRLLTIPELRDTAKPLIERVTQVAKKARTDPTRIAAFIQNLTATPEERAYAIGELRRAGAAAAPYLVAALQASAGTDAHGAIFEALLRMPDEIVPALMAALGTRDAALQYELIDLFQRRGNVTAVPALWYPSAAAQVGENVRRKAIEALTYLLGKPAEKLPEAKIALTAEANRYYQHRVRFPDSAPATVWEWDGSQLLSHTTTASEAEEYYGLRYARQALALDPAYGPAQVVFLSLALEKGFERSGIDQPLERGAPDVRDLVREANPVLVNAVLDRALVEHRLPVILGAVRALGDAADVRALRPIDQREPALLRALDYPDRRVDLAAADAVLKIPGSSGLTRSSRIVEILRRTAAADPVPRAIVADFNRDRAEQVAAAVRTAGFDPFIAATGREVVQRVTQAADVDVLLVDYAIPDPPLSHLLAQLRQDVFVGHLPILVTVPPDTSGNIPADLQPGLERIVRGYRNVWLIPTTTDPAALKDVIGARLIDALGRPLSDAERKDNAALAMLWLKRLATGEVSGYDVRPAEGAILKGLETSDLAPLAIEAAGHLPGARAQRALADVVLRNPRPELKAAAAAELTRHVQQHNLALTKEQIRGIDELYAATKDPRLKSVLALVEGGMRPSAELTGQRLGRYNPAFRPPPSPLAPPVPRQPQTEK